MKNNITTWFFFATITFIGILLSLFLIKTDNKLDFNIYKNELTLESNLVNLIFEKEVYSEITKIEQKTFIFQNKKIKIDHVNLDKLKIYDKLPNYLELPVYLDSEIDYLFPMTLISISTNSQNLWNYLLNE